MVDACVICLGASGQALAGKRCRASACKKAYAERLAALKAARTGNATSLREYLDKGYGPNSRQHNKDGATVLQMACQEGHQDCVEVLLEHRPIPHTYSEERQREAGCHPGLPNTNNTTPAWRAVRGGRHRIE